MATIIRLGGTFLTLAKVTHFQFSPLSITAYFSDGEDDFVSFTGTERAALLAYLNDAAFDVIAWQEDTCQVEAAVRPKTDRLQPPFTDPRAPRWRWEDAHDEAFCTRCGHGDEAMS